MKIKTTDDIASQLSGKRALALRSLLQTALDMGIEIERAPFGNNQYTFYLYKNGHTLVASKFNHYSDLSFYGHAVAKDKYKTFLLLQKHGINTPHTQLLELKDCQQPSLENHFVLKPRDGGLGKDVYIIKEKEDWDMAIKSLCPRYETILLQNCMVGEDLRIQVVGGKFFAACQRIPANVIGNGISTIEELIHEKNKKKLPGNTIRIDPSLEKLIQAQGHALHDIVEDQKYLRLREVSNIGAGGDILDVTDKVHSSYHDLCKQLSSLIRVRNFAIDVITTDPSQDFTKAGSVIEINAPCMWFHHNIAHPTPRDVGRAILEDWLAHPESY